MVGHGWFSLSFMLTALFMENFLLHETCPHNGSGILGNPIRSLYKQRPGCSQNWPCSLRSSGMSVSGTELYCFTTFRVQEGGVGVSEDSDGALGCAAVGAPASFLHPCLSFRAQPKGPAASGETPFSRACLFIQTLTQKLP